MTRWALVVGGMVANVIEQDDAPTAPGQWVDGGEAGPGWLFDGQAFSVPVQAAPRRVTRLAFRGRFLPAEKVAIELASIDDAGAAPEQRQQAAGLRVYLADLAAATFVDLARVDTRAAVQSLESNGLLAAGRALEILDGDISQSEVPL